MAIYRTCMICNTRYGCYTNRKRACRSCHLKACPLTADISHGLCEECGKLGMKALE